MHRNNWHSSKLLKDWWCWFRSKFHLVLFTCFCLDLRSDWGFRPILLLSPGQTDRSQSLIKICDQSISTVTKKTELVGCSSRRRVGVFRPSVTCPVLVEAHWHGGEKRTAYKWMSRGKYQANHVSSQFPAYTFPGWKSFQFRGFPGHCTVCHCGVVFDLQKCKFTKTEIV